MPHRQQIVHAIAGHRHLVPPLLQSSDQHLFLLRGNATEHGMRFGGAHQLLIGQTGRVQQAVRVAHAAKLCNRGGSHRIIAGDDLHLHPLLIKIVNGLHGIFTQLVRNHDGGDKLDMIGIDLSPTDADKQHTFALLHQCFCRRWDWAA